MIRKNSIELHSAAVAGRQISRQLFASLGGRYITVKESGYYKARFGR